MSIAEIKSLPREEKLKLMEMLWTELSADDEKLESPDWHRVELEKTRARFDAGLEETLDWEDAKKELRREFE